MGTSAIQQSAISDLIKNQRKFIQSGKTRDIDFRIKQLRTLRTAIIKNEAAILEACKSDMNKPPMEAYTSERGMVLNEIDHAARNLKSWAKPTKEKTPLLHTRFFGIAQHFLASSYIYSEPYGVVLVIGPWNYPFQLTLSPLVGAIAAGNCTILKPSEIAPCSSSVISKIIKDNFDPGLISVVEGDAKTAQKLLLEKFDYIFFTGGTKVGTIVMEAAAKHLTPVTLELGGKNPLVVCDDADLDNAAKWVLLSAYSNAGQRCASTSRVIVFDAVYETFCNMLVERARKMRIGPTDEDDFGPVINEVQLNSMLSAVAEACAHGATILAGGQRLIDAAHRNGFYMAPTLIEGVDPHADISECELFGPVALLYRVKDFEEALALANDSPYGLTASIHTRSIHRAMRFCERVESGVAVVNAGTHGSEPHMPFGGRKQSGNGSREPGTEALDVYSELKDIYINIDPAQL